MITPGITTINIVQPIAPPLPEPYRHPTSFEPIHITLIVQDFGRMLTFAPETNADRNWMLENTTVLTVIIGNIESQYLGSISDKRSAMRACYDFHNQLRAIYPYDTFVIKASE